MQRFSKLLIFSLITGLASCAPPRHRVAEALSPDGKLIAYVMQEEPRSLIMMNNFVFIKPVARALDEKRDLVFMGGDMNGRGYGPINLRWLENGALWIGYCDGRISIYHNSWLDSYSSTPTEVEVILEREPLGKWPVSAPPNGTGGLPPCD